MKALVLLIISGILTSGVFIAGKQAGSEQLSPLMILFWQMSGGALLVWVVAWPTRRFPIWDITHVRYYLIGGLLGITLPYILAFIVLRELQVGIVGLITALSPIVTYGMARLLGLESGHPLRLIGLAIGLGGVALLVTPQNPTDFAGNWHFMLLALGIPLALAVSNIYRSRYWPPNSEAMPLVIGMLSVQAIGLLIANLLVGNFHQALPNTQNIALLLTALALMAGASYLTSFNLLKVGGPVYLSQMGYVITAVTMLAGIALWGDQYNSTDLLSIGFILTGLLLTTLTGNAQSSKPAPIRSSQST